MHLRILVTYSAVDAVLCVCGESVGNSICAGTHRLKVFNKVLLKSSLNNRVTTG